jgi:hypothetical protein
MAIRKADWDRIKRLLESAPRDSNFSLLSAIVFVFVDRYLRKTTEHYLQNIRADLREIESIFPAAPSSIEPSERRELPPT